MVSLAVKEIEDRIIGILDSPWKMTPGGLIRRKVFVECEGVTEEVLAYNCTLSNSIDNAKGQNVDLVTAAHPFHLDLSGFDSLEAEELNNDILLHIQ